MQKLREQAKANRINVLHSSEYFVKAFDLPVASGSLRNAISHSDYKYDGIKQEMNYLEKSGGNVVLNSYLIDVVLECSKIMCSTFFSNFERRKIW